MKHKEKKSLPAPVGQSEAPEKSKKVKKDGLADQCPKKFSTKMSEEEVTKFIESVEAVPAEESKPQTNPDDDTDEAPPVLDLNEGEADELRSLAKKLVTVSDKLNYRLAGTLYKIFGSRVFKRWQWETFQEYVEIELAFSLRKARYLMKIYWVCENKLTPEQREKALALGWTKLKELSNVIDQDNADEWIERAEELSASELIEEVRVTTGRKSIEEKIVKTLRVPMSDAQAVTIEKAIEIAKTISKSDATGHNVEMICLGFLAENDTTVKNTTWAKHLIDRIAEVSGVKAEKTEDIIAMIETVMKAVPSEDVRKAIGSKATGPLAAKELLIYLRRSKPAEENEAANEEAGEEEEEIK
jgi:hypothetical protein